MGETVVVLGAGATKSVGGPLTSEILPGILQKLVGDPRMPQLMQFLTEAFHVGPAAQNTGFPGLPLLMSLLDTALDRRQGLYGQWTAETVAGLREAVEVGIFELLEKQLQQNSTIGHYDLLARIYPAPAQPRIISLNYDLIIDTTLLFYSERYDDSEGRFPDYGCDIMTDFYRNETQKFGTLLKLHGSLNWLHCKTCNRLEIGASEKNRYIKRVGKLLSQAGRSLDVAYASAGSACPTCATALRPLLIAPTHRKDYRNPHLAQVWYEAEHLLRRAGRVVFVGYSMPEDDVEVVYLLKRSLAHLTPDRITVVELDTMNRPVGAHEVGRRYRSLFGDGIDWHTGGMVGWVLEQPLPPLGN